jgi:hypothetical protein
MSQFITVTSGQPHFCMTEESHGVLDLVLPQFKGLRRGLGRIKTCPSRISVHAADAAGIHGPLCYRRLLTQSDPVTVCAQLLCFHAHVFTAVISAAMV